MAHDVFISHSSKDKVYADAVCATLESYDIRCWVAPRDILPGSDYGSSIVEGLKASKVMILIFHQIQMNPFTSNVKWNVQSIMVLSLSHLK